MPQVFNIPLKPGIAQTFLVTLVGIDYRFVIQWRDAIATWVLDIKDSSSVPLVCGIPLITGANLLEQFPDLNFGGELWIMTDGAPSDPPTYSNLGITSHLRFIVDGTLLWKFT